MAEKTKLSIEMNEYKSSIDAVDQVIEDADYLRHQKSLVRKLDYTLLPMLWVLYMFNYLDRNNIRYVLV